MKLTLDNFRCHGHAELNLDAPVTLIAGPNAAGKTAICQALAAALTGDAMVLEKLTKAGTLQLVRDGETEAAVILANENGQASVAWPTCKVLRTGTPPDASPTAVGRTRLSDLDQRDRAAYVSEVLKAVPTINDLAKTVGDASAAKLWKTIAVQGWDGAYQQARDAVARLKGRWEQITGQRYGSNKADAWRPDGLPDEGQGEDALAQRVQALRKELDGCVVAAAIDESAKTQLQEMATDLPALRELQAQADGTLLAARAALKAHPPDPETTANCPHCGKAVQVMSRTELRVPPATLTAEALAAHRAKRAELDGKVAHAQDETMLAAQQVHAAEGAAAKLAEMQAAPASEPTEDPEPIRTALAAAERALAALLLQKQATEMGDQIKQGQVVVEALAPEGLRQQALAAALGTLNERMGQVCAVAKWAPVTLSAGLRVSFGGRLYELCSASEQYRADATIQLTVARWYDTSKMLVLDGADILDGPGRTGLLVALGRMKRPAVVAMTEKRERVPALGAKGMGRTYWVDAAGVVEVTE